MPLQIETKLRFEWLSCNIRAQRSGTIGAMLHSQISAARGSPFFVLFFGERKEDEEETRTDRGEARNPGKQGVEIETCWALQ